MEFKNFKKAFQAHFAELVTHADQLFEVDVNKDELWDTYLNSFPEGTNPIYRERTVHDCSCCRHFIRTIGGMVVIKDNQVHTIWGFNTGETTYQPVVDALDALVKSKAVNGVYLTREAKIGTDQNVEVLPTGGPIRWEHLYAELPACHVYRGSESIGDRQNTYRTTKAVFKRSLEEITDESIATVLELITSNTLYRGAEWKLALEKFAEYKRRYSALPDAEKDTFAWVESIKAGVSVAKIRNHSIGTLLVDVSNGEDLDVAVRKYEAIVAPANYKRPKAIFTAKMLEEAKAKIAELGYMESLPRRFATLDDVTVNNILFANRDAAKRITGTGDVFDAMLGEVKPSPRKFSKVEEIPVEKFIAEVLPTATELEVYLEAKHANSMVSLIAPAIDGSKSMFKWGNPYSWAYTGNMTDSAMKERVKAAGGDVNGVLRFSIQWNDTPTYSRNDVDAHCYEPGGNHIFYMNKKNYSTGGNLDVDITSPVQGRAAVENITWPDKRRMAPGRYKFFVHQFANRGGRDGFRAEIEFDGQIYSFDYPHELRQGANVEVADVILGQDGQFTIEEKLASSVSSRDVWGIKTNNFVPVSVVMFSPNYWDEQKGIGNKHYFFMLKGCVNPEAPNGFYNEFLKDELVVHKRVFEALGGKMAVAAVEDQLSGVGFSSTKRDSLVVKVKGQVERIMKIKF